MKWKIDATVSMHGVGRDNMPLDLKTVSDKVDETDHAMVMSIEDPLLDLVGIEFKKDTEFPTQFNIGEIGDVIVFDSDPTCEMMAQWMADRLVNEIEAVTEVEIVVEETDKYGIGASAEGCTCGENEGCDECGGR